MPDPNSRVVHQIWMNSEPIPSELARIRESWKGEEVRLWDRADVMVIPGIEEHLSLARRIWFDAPVLLWKSMSDIARIAILRDFGGLYVDLDMERVRDPWPVLEAAAQDDRVVFVRPRLPERLNRTNPCNGMIYGKRDEESAIYDDMLWKMRNQMIACIDKPQGTPKPMHVTGPSVVNWAAVWARAPVIQPPFLAFKGRETPETCVITHHQWKRARP